MTGPDGDMLIPRDYTWYARDGVFVRSPIRVAGVSIGAEDRRAYETVWLESERQRRTRRSSAREGDAEEPVSADDALMLHWMFSGLAQEAAQAASDSGDNEVEPRFVAFAWVRLFFVEEFSPYSWAFLPADASLQCSFRGDSNQASAYPRLSGGQPSLVTAPNTCGLLPDRRAPFWTFARGSGTVPWEGRQTCDGCDDRIPGTYIRRAPNLRPLHRSPEASPVRSGRCCLRGCQSLPLVQRSPADERERTRTGTAPAGPGVGAQAPARTSRPTQPERGCWSGRGHQRCRVLGAARARKPRRNGLRHDAGCGSGLRAARSRRLASARCRAEPAAGALPGRDAPPRDHRDRLAGTTAYALEATVVLDIIHVAAATRRAVLVAGSSKGLSAFGPRSDGRRPALSRRG